MGKEMFQRKPKTSDLFSVVPIRVAEGYGKHFFENPPTPNPHCHRLCTLGVVIPVTANHAETLKDRFQRKIDVMGDAFLVLMSQGDARLSENRKGGASKHEGKALRLEDVVLAYDIKWRRWIRSTGTTTTISFTCDK
jgi:hypothetical protein